MCVYVRINGPSSTECYPIAPKNISEMPTNQIISLASRRSFCTWETHQEKSKAEMAPEATVAAELWRNKINVAECVDEDCQSKRLDSDITTSLINPVIIHFTVRSVMKFTATTTTIIIIWYLQ